MQAILAKDGAMVYTELPVPVCGEDEILIKVVAAGVNRPDVSQRKGSYPAPPGHSPVLGLEVSGLVVSKGEKASRFQINDKVCALVNGGGYAQFVVVPETQCLPVPSSLDMVSAACICETFFTVWHNVFQLSNTFQQKLTKGDTLLIHGGSSGIGTTAIQLAKQLGIHVIATVGSDEKCKSCLDLGADHVINYKTSDFETEVRRITDGKGVNVILDMVAGAYIQKDLSILKVQGRIAIIGELGGATGELNYGVVMRKRLTIGGSTLRAQPKEAKAKIAQELLEVVWPLFEQKKISPLVDSVFPFESAALAHEKMESSVHVGKIALTFEK